MINTYICWDLGIFICIAYTWWLNFIFVQNPIGVLKVLCIHIWGTSCNFMNGAQGTNMHDICDRTQNKGCSRVWLCCCREAFVLQVEHKQLLMMGKSCCTIFVKTILGIFLSIHEYCDAGISSNLCKQKMNGIELRALAFDVSLKFRIWINKQINNYFIPIKFPPIFSISKRSSSDGGNFSYDGLGYGYVSFLAEYFNATYNQSSF